jgi:5'(3')-deoxyribonucleotidase
MKVDRVLSLFPELSFDSFIITKNKQLVKCNVLIDDGTHNLEKGEYYRLLMDRPWNRDYNEEKNGILRVCDFNDIYSAITKISKL